MVGSGVAYFSRTAEYALRAMAELALASDEEAVPAVTLANGGQIPPHYLSKIMRKLVAANLVIATKGPGGGFRLARRRDSIRFLDIVAAVGEQPDPDRCVFGSGRCHPKDPCPLHPAFALLNNELWRWATETTLANIPRGWGNTRGPSSAVAARTPKKGV